MITRRWSPRSWSPEILAGFLYVILAGNILQAQQTPNAAPGFRSDGVYDFSGVDNVALFNGALSVDIPLGIEYPAGGGFGYRLALRYSSSPWDSRTYSDPCTLGGCPVEFQPKQTHDAGLGWRLTLPELLGEDNVWNQTQSWVYVGADGGEHVFYDKLHPADAEDVGDSGGFGGVQLVQYSRDGSYLRLQRATTTATTVTVELPNGHIHTFDKVGSEWLLSRMEDRYGNGVDVTYGIDGGKRTTTLDDGFRSHVITFADQGIAFPEQRWLVETLEVAAFNSTTATYGFTYATKTANRPPAHNFPSLDRSKSVRVLTAVSLPSGASYTMPDAVGAPAYEGSGMLTRLRLPTLGYLEWDWDLVYFPVFRTKLPSQSDNEILEPFNAVMAVTTRRQKDISGNTFGEWTYARELDREDPLLESPQAGSSEDRLPETLTVTVHRPLGDKGEHYFSVYPAKELTGWPLPDSGTKWNEYSLPYTRSVSDPKGGPRYLSSKIFDCDDEGASCEEVRAVYVEYELDTDGGSNDASGILFNKNRRVKSQRTIDKYLDFGGDAASHYKLESYSDFDGLGHYRTTTVTSDYGPTRTGITGFNPGGGSYPGSFTQKGKDDAWITGLYDSQSTTENGKTAAREYCFDTATGSLMRTRVFESDAGERDNKDLVQVLGYDGSGQVTSQEWHGGNLYADLATDVDLCVLSLGAAVFELAHTYASGALETSRYIKGDGTAMDFYVTEHTIDGNTGLVSRSKAPSGLETTFTFDRSGRLTWIEPSAASGAATTRVSYVNASNASLPARAEVRELPNGSTNLSEVMTEKRYHYDGLGRLSRERIRRPAIGNDFLSDRYTVYDAEGRKHSENPWGFDRATATTWEEFDAFGRPHVIYPPDATPDEAAHAIRIDYEGFRKIRRTVSVGTTFSTDSVTESNVSRIEEYDAHGRLIAVTEPSGSAGANVRTSYAYDVGDRLISASTPLAGVLSQTRTWTYDQRGFLTKECHPEIGTTGNGCVTYSRFDALGQARKAVDGPFSRLYQYDRASRLLAIREEHDGGTRLLKSWTYGAASSAGNHALGQVVQAINYQYPGDAFESRLVEDFRYGGPGGVRDYRKVSWVKECTAGDITNKEDCQDDGFATEEVFEHSETFDATGKVASITYPICIDRDEGCGPQVARTVSYTYHASSGFLTAVPGWVDGITYHPNMTVSTVQHANGIQDVQGEDPDSMSRPASIHSQDEAGAVLWETGTFHFDGAGNLVRLAADTFTDRFRYDGVSRLVESEQWVGSPPFIFGDGFESGDLAAWGGAGDGLRNTTSRQVYTFDVPGNLQSVTTDGVLESHGIVTATNRIGGSTYDGAGNLTRYVTTADDGSDVQVDLVYDAFNRLVERSRSGATTLYLYTADDERIVRFEGGDLVWTLRDLQGRLLREFRGEAKAGGGSNMVAQRDQIYRGTSLVGTVTKAPNGSLTKVHHYHLDHLGSPRLVTDKDGVLESEHRYYPFGEEATSSVQDGHPMKFTGHERDFNQQGEGDDLDYMHARYCDPQMGRFLSVDPVQGTPPSPQSWNRYAYVRGNPMMYTDPTGEEMSQGQKEMLSLAASFVPWVSEAKDAQEAVFGVNLITGVRLTKTERVAAAIGILVPIVSTAVIVKGLNAAGDLKSAATRAKEIHRSVGSRTQQKTAIAVTETQEGIRVVSSSEGKLRPVQRQLLESGEVEGFGTALEHAEVNSVKAARMRGLNPTGTAASRPICDDCLDFLVGQGVSPPSPLKRDL